MRIIDYIALMDETNQGDKLIELFEVTRDISREYKITVETVDQRQPLPENSFTIVSIPNTGE